MKHEKVPKFLYELTRGDVEGRMVLGNESVFQAWLVCHLGADLPITIRSEAQSMMRDWGSPERFLNSEIL